MLMCRRTWGKQNNLAINHGKRESYYIVTINIIKRKKKMNPFLDWL